MIRAMADGETAKALLSVLERISAACTRRPAGLHKQQPRLVAVSKTKPVSLIQEAYAAGQRHFGENYVQELEEKGKDPVITEKCKDIHWHFIGHLQRNKVNKVLNVPNLFMIETIDSEKLATAVSQSWERLKKQNQLKVMIQINTSAEENKYGCEASKASELVDHVKKNCPGLEVAGLMTIGAFDHDLSNGPNPDFQRLIKCREEVSEILGLPPDELELSMGMSGDFEHAIEVGSTNIRVGSTIFGARTYPNKPKPTTDSS